MRGRRALVLAAAALFVAGAAAAQSVFVPIQAAQPARYLLTTEPVDARALWVNPAGLARQMEASLGVEMSADRFTSGGMQLREWGGTIASHGVAAGWAHERYPNGASLNVYNIGLGLGDEQFSAGVARRWYRGVVAGSAWDVGLRAAAWPGTDFSLVMRNLGSPRLGDSTFWATLVPGALVRFFGGRVQVAGEAEIAPHGWQSVEYRAGGSVAIAGGFSLLLRADLAPDFKRRGLVVALDFQRSGSRAAAFAALPGGGNQVDAFGASAALVTRASAIGR